jgi:hypothetical protein
LLGHGSQFIKESAVEQMSYFLSQAYQYRAEQESLLKNEPGCKHCNAKKLGDVTTLNVTGLKAGSDSMKQCRGFFFFFFFGIVWK